MFCPCLKKESENHKVRVLTQYKTNINILVDCNPVIAAAKPTYHNHSVVYRYN